MDRIDQMMKKQKEREEAMKAKELAKKKRGGRCTKG